ncbi:heparan-alpha-glucosaminide N-acetyltransferase [Methanococcoides sp. AM1]|uniref:heparan-alpha-glucosaminide N-acetyltransferase n=1 Tax=Methanococcoides sp. AM1 TaxID=1201011 RepID=UPI001083225A|nr:heparan-alpha-glucosaminide N-acetyltransferase [Methanococcoides sp. AM1]
MTELHERFWEIDLLRGIAIIMMVGFHLLYDINYLGAYDINLATGPGFIIGRLSAILFIMIGGISLSLSYSRKQRIYDPVSGFIKYTKRGLKIFLWGMVITAGSYIFLRDGVIVFGILHFIGVAIILAYPFLKYKVANLMLAIPVIALGSWMQTFDIGNTWLFWIGLRPEGFHSYDYFPLFPWFGVLLLGIFLGNSLYPNYKRTSLTSGIPNISAMLSVKTLCYMGERSLLIYLLHQPMLVILLYATGIADLNQLYP